MNQPTALQALRELHLKKAGVLLSDTEALALLTALANLVEAVYQTHKPSSYV